MFVQFCLISRVDVVLESLKSRIGLYGVAHRPVVFISTFTGKNQPLKRQTRRTFNRSRANLNGPIRNDFIVFC